MISVIAISIILVYLCFLGMLCYGFDRVKPFHLQDLKPKTTFSVIIPFRNEAKTLPHLLNSILKLNYPKNLFEVILIDDDSDDNSVDIIKSFINNASKEKNGNNNISIRVISNKRISLSPKKDAISLAISIAKNKWIITTDADCKVPQYWLSSFDECIQNKTPNCIVAPIAYSTLNSFFYRFQALDILSLQGATIGGFGLKRPFLCNGANFAYKASLFTEVNGFDGNTTTASGDDIFLLEKFKQVDQQSVVYLKSSKAIVTTHPVSNTKQLIQQRLRWASKTSRNPNIFSKLLGLIIVLANFICITIPFLLFLGLIEIRVAMALIIIKLAIDFLLLFKSSRFFNQERILISYLSSSVLYPFFCVYIALLSLFKPYQWKGRTFKT